MNKLLKTLLLHLPFAFLFTGLAQAGSINPVTDHISYQGQLQQAGQPYSGALPMVFRLWPEESGGVSTGFEIAMNVEVADGLFQVDLDFGNAYGTEAKWLEIEVDGAVLEPRQRIRAAPLALHALSAPGSSSPWTVSGGDIHYSAGNVGIGTQQPQGRLHIETGSDPSDPPFMVRMGDSTRLFLHPNGGLAVGHDSVTNTPPALGLWVNGAAAFGDPVILADLGPAGATPLCRNTGSQIGTCGGQSYGGPRWAVVSGDGTLVRHSGATNVSRASAGTYFVTLDRNVSACSWTATMGLDGNGAPPIGFISVAWGESATLNPNVVRVRTSDTNGANADRGFHLLVHC